MASNLQDYFANIEVHQEESDQTPSQSEVDTMIAYLSEEIPVTEAARSLTRRTAQSTSIDTLKLRKSGLWYLINEIAVNLPAVQPLIVDLLKTIRTLGLPEVTDQGSNYVVLGDTWSKLDAWTNRWADSINSKISFQLLLFITNW
jgi:hypothetical protein